MSDPSALPGRRGRVVLWGTCDTGKPRVRILRDGLHANNVELVECRADIWGGIEDKSQVKGARRWLRLLAGIVFAYPRLVWRYLRLPPHDWVLLGYPAIPDIFVIRVFAWLRGSRLAMDWFISAYDTVVLDRRLVGKRHPLAWLLWITEWAAIRLADTVFMDTQAHARRMETLFHLPPHRCDAVWVGAEELFFQPCATSAPHPAGAPLRVLFYGQFIPLHGVGTIIEAARLLRGQPVDWILIGQGQEAPRVRTLLESDPLPRMQWLPWVPYADLRRHIADADVCLGIFGTSDKAASVIPNKVFQVLAAGKALVTRDSPAIRELLAPAPPMASLVDAGDAAGLAAAVLACASDPGALRAAIRPSHPFDPRSIGRALVGLLGRDTPQAALP